MLTPYKTFAELFEAALLNKCVAGLDHSNAVLLNMYGVLFNDWLLTIKKWDATDRAFYLKHLTPAVWIEFRMYEEGRKNKGRGLRELNPDIMQHLLKLKNNPELWKQPLANRELSAPVIALFCSIVAQSKLMPKGSTASVTDHCKKVCEKFKLTYTDRVRQNYSISPTKKNLQLLKQDVLPYIDTDSRNYLLGYLASR